MSEQPTQREWWALQNDVDQLKKDMAEIKLLTKTTSENVQGIRYALEGNPPHSTGMRGEFNTLRKDHDDLEGNFDTFQKTYGTGQAKREGMFSGARVVWIFIVAGLGMFATIITLILNINRLLGGAGG